MHVRGGGTCTAGLKVRGGDPVRNGLSFVTGHSSRWFDHDVVERKPL